jgi:capsular exopolysaccharide synthesis family protein
MSMDIGERSTWGAGGSDLRRELRVLWTHRWLIVSVTAMVVALAVAYTLFTTPIYTSTATVFIKPTGVNVADFTDVEKLISSETEVAVATSQQVSDIALACLQGDEAALSTMLGDAYSITPSCVASGESGAFADATSESLLKHVSVDVPASSQVLQVHYEDPSAKKSAAGAAAFANAYLEYRSAKSQTEVTAQLDTIDQKITVLTKEKNAQVEIRANSVPGSAEYQQADAEVATLDNQISYLNIKQADLYGINTDPGTVVSEPVVPTAPSSPNKQMNIALGLFAGLFLGVGLAFLKNRTDNRLREREQLELALGAPVLSMVPRVEGWRNREEAKLITIADPLSPAAEAYRVLRPVLLAAAAKRGVKTVMVLSPMAGEGKSTTAANLSVVLAQSGRSVALVTADLRRPRAHQFFEVEPEPGLSEFLAGNATLSEIERRVSQQAGGDLVVYPAGRLRAHPAEQLQSRQMQRFLEDQREAFDFVIIDCPPVLAVSDALPLIPLSDGVLFVVDAENTTREQVSLARDRLLQMGANLLGAVINGLSGSSSGYYDDRYGYTYTSSNGDGQKEKRGHRLARRSGTKA